MSACKPLAHVRSSPPVPLRLLLLPLRLPALRLPAVEVTCVGKQATVRYPAARGLWLPALRLPDAEAAAAAACSCVVLSTSLPPSSRAGDLFPRGCLFLCRAFYVPSAFVSRRRSVSSRLPVPVSCFLRPFRLRLAPEICFLAAACSCVVLSTSLPPSSRAGDLFPRGCLFLCRAFYVPSAFATRLGIISDSH